MTNKPENNPPAQEEPLSRPGSTETISAAGAAEVVISDDKYSCWIVIKRSSEGALPEKGAVLRAIEDAHIKQELIKNEEIDRIFTEVIIDQKVLIAQGQPKKDGKNGSVKYLFKTGIEDLLKEGEKGKVNYKEVSFIQFVSAGTPVVELIPPEKGTPGLTVTGETIPVKDGNPAQVPSGINIAVSSQNPNQIVSTLDGSVSLKRNKIVVDPIVVIEGDVDFSTGNVNFKGAVVIKGGVKSGFSVKSQSDVTINEVVEDAVIEAEGNVTLKSGFVGRGVGSIKAGGDIFLPFAENQSIYAGGSVYVSDVLLHCTVESNGKVIVSGNKGVIGGSISAYELIEAQSVGSQTFTKTILSVGMKKETREKIEQWSTSLKTNRGNVEKVNKAFGVLNKINLLKRGLPPKHQQLYNDLVAVRTKLQDEEKQLIALKTELEEEQKKTTAATIKIIQKIYPGVRIEFGTVKKIVQEEIQKVVFMLKDDEIIVVKS